jgi:hypothetical protein
MRTFLLAVLTGVTGAVVGWKLHAAFRGTIVSAAKKVEEHTHDLAAALQQTGTREIFIRDLVHQGMSREEAEAATEAICQRRSVVATTPEGVEVLS